MLSPSAGDEAVFMEIAGHRLHYRWLSPDVVGAPVLFLHDGLGSVDLWRGFPQGLVEACRHPGLAYSRYGNGWSDPLTGPRPPDYMHDEALRTLPEIIDTMVSRPPVLVGHSDGASIALIYAGSGHPVEGLVLLAPHVFVERRTTQQIAAVRDGFATSDMPAKMGRYHVHPEATFRGWADVWLSPAFRSWSIEKYLPGVRCPILLIQGDDDEYGTTRQLDAVETAVPTSVQRLMVAGAQHSPHLSHPDLVIAASSRFIAGLG